MLSRQLLRFSRASRCFRASCSISTRGKLAQRNFSAQTDTDSSSRQEKQKQNQNQTQQDPTEQGYDWKTLGFITFCLGTAALTTNLGLWQIERRKQKIAAIEDRKDRLYHSVFDSLDSVISRYDDDIEYRTARVRGRFDYSKQILVGPRNAADKSAVQQRLTRYLALSSSSSSSASTSHAHGNGFFVYTPLVLADGSRILVNRGWVDTAMKNAIPEEKADADGMYEFIGVFRKGEERPRYLPEYDPTSTGSYLFVDMPLMSAKADVTKMVHDQPLLLDLVDPKDVLFPIRKDREEYFTFRTSPETHAIYFSTWFSLSAALVGLTYLRFRKHNFRLPRKTLKAVKH